jgi:hypothetical protein
VNRSLFGGYNDGVKLLALLFCLAGLGLAQERPGNFNIRFEPTAKLQTEAEIPFQINVLDDLSKPVIGAKVTLQIETPEHQSTRVFKSPETAPGTYVAKPVFPSPGTWSVYVEVKRNDLMTARTIEFNVPRNAE